MLSATTVAETEGRLVDGRYELGRLISHGGLGVVYEARHIHVGTRVAIKTLHPELVDDSRIRQRLLREAGYLGNIRHPNVVGVLDAGICERRGAFLVMDLLLGRPLDGWITSRTRLGAEEARPILTSILDALDAIHARGVVHRDLKPANVVVVGRAEPRAVVVDFGIATELSGRDARMRLTSDGVVPGTLEYLSPELCAGQPASRGSDVFSFGVLAFEALTGQVPYPSGAIAADVARQPDAPAKLLASSNVPRAIADVIVTCIALDPSRRYRDASQVRGALDAAYHSEVHRPATTPSGVPNELASRRAHTRSPYVTPLRVMLMGGGEIDGRSEDIAEGGLLLITQQSMSIGDVVMLRLPLPMTGRTETLPATVRWVKPGRLRHAIGVAFDAIGDRAREEIVRYVDLCRVRPTSDDGS